MPAIKLLFSLTLLLTCLPSNGVAREQSPPAVHHLPNTVRDSRCLAIAKKKQRSLGDVLYQKIRCQGFQLPKLQFLKPKVKVTPAPSPKAKKAPRRPSPSPRPKKKPAVKKRPSPSPRPKKKTVKKRTSSSPKPKKKTTPKKKPSPSPRPKKKTTSNRRPSPSPKRKKKPTVKKRPSPSPKPKKKATKLKITNLPKLKKPTLPKQIPKLTTAPKPKKRPSPSPRPKKKPAVKKRPSPSPRPKKKAVAKKRPSPSRPKKKAAIKKRPSPSPRPKPTKRSKPATKPKSTTKPKPTTKPKGTNKPKRRPSPSPSHKKPVKRSKPTSKPKATNKPKRRLSPSPRAKKNMKRSKPTSKPKPTAKPKSTLKPKATTKSRPTTKPNETNKKSKSKIINKRSSQPSKTPSPRPIPSPSPSITKLKQSLEEAKKRIVNNIKKHEQNSKPKSTQKVCKTEEYTCGRKCSGRAGPRFLCYYPNRVPKFCTRKTARPGFCGDHNGTTCIESVMEPHMCTRNVSVTEYCPGAEEGCRFNDVPFGRCLPDQCDRWKKKKCVYDRRKIVTACKKPRKRCSDCKGRFLLKTCPKNVTQRIKAPCPGNMSLPTFDEELLGDGIESIYLRDLLCFDSFFDESACNDSPRVCRMFDEMFDRRLCAGIVCQQCSELMSMHASEDVKDVCRSLLGGTCKAAGEFADTKEISENEDTCYGTETVEKMLPCYEQLPSKQICAQGCAVKSCKKTFHEVKGYCERNLPERCLKDDEVECRRETRKVRDCSGQRICRYVVKKPYLCFREKQVEVPCDSGCEVLQEERYVCGSEKQEVEAVCREELDHSCRDLTCSRQVCH